MPLSDFNLPNRIIAEMMAQEHQEKCQQYLKDNPPPPPPPLVPTADRMAALHKKISCEPEGPLECDELRAMCKAVKMDFTSVGDTMDMLDALLDYVAAVAPVLAEAKSVKLTGDCATDVGALCAAYDVPYAKLDDALVELLGALGSDFTDEKKRAVMAKCEDKNMTRVMKEIGKTYRFKATTPCFRETTKTEVTWKVRLTEAELEKLMKEQEEADDEDGQE
jgi:ribosomal protein L12E/L44/L45/RPP1/RPP2